MWVGTYRCVSLAPGRPDPPVRPPDQVGGGLPLIKRKYGFRRVICEGKNKMGMMLESRAHTGLAVLYDAVLGETGCEGA